MPNDSIQTSTGVSNMNGHPRNRCPPHEQEKDFAASLAHELNNPLEALRNLLYLIDRKVAFSQELRHHVALAGEEVGRISRILRTAMKEFRDGADSSGMESTNVAELLLSVLNFYKSRLESRGISLKHLSRQNATIPAYPRQLRQMFSNLLLNAADAMPNGGKIETRISIARERNNSGRRGVRLTFADNGTGIAAKDLPKISEPFFTTKGAAGNGLGLTLVKETVKKHHGVLRVRSSTRHGRSGTVFAIFLPFS
jgi:two-component system CheB/CheR fusion protein